MAATYTGNVKAGSTSVSLGVLLRKVADSTEQTGVAYNAAGLVVSYQREMAARTGITLASQTVTGVWTQGGWVEVDATNMPGLYRLDVPDAAFAAGADWVIVSVKYAGCFVYYERFDLATSVAGDPVASVTGNVGGNVVGSVASVVADVGITQTAADKVWSSTTRALTDKIGFALSAAGIKAIWDQLTSALTTAGSIGKKLTDWVLGSDNKNVISADVHAAGVTVAAVAGNVAGSVGSLATQAKSDVNAEVMHCLSVDTLPENVQDVPPTNPTIYQLLMYLFMALANQSTASDSEFAIYNAAGVKIAKQALTDDGTTTTAAKMVSGA